MSVVRLIVVTWSSNILISGNIIKEMPGSVASVTHCTNSINAHFPIFYTIHSFRLLSEEHLVLLTWALMLSQDVVADQAFNVTIAVVFSQVILDTPLYKMGTWIFPTSQVHTPDRLLLIITSH